MGIQNDRSKLDFVYVDMNMFEIPDHIGYANLSDNDDLFFAGGPDLNF